MRTQFLNQSDTTCAECGSEIPKGDIAHLDSSSDDPLCQNCVDRIDDEIEFDD